MPLPRERLGTTRDAKAEAQELRELRTSFGVTQVQMAQLLDVSAASYYRWEAGKSPCPLMALELMRCWAREERARTRRRK